MAQPIFLSYSWDDSCFGEADQLDALLRLRGVPVWRDRRDMRLGSYHEDLVRAAVRDDCSGFVLHLTEPALKNGGFIATVELPAMDDRRKRDRSFIHGVIYRNGAVTEWANRVQADTQIDLSGAFGYEWRDSESETENLRLAANQILSSYLAREWTGGPVELSVQTRGSIPWTESGHLHMSWSPPLEHDMDQHDRNAWADSLQPALRDLRVALEARGLATDLRTGGNVHLSAALALGHEFRKPTGWDLSLTGSAGEEWVSDRGPSTTPDGWQINVTPGGASGSKEMVLAVHASHDITGFVRAHGALRGPAARCEIHAYPPASSTQSIDPADGNRIASAIADEVRTARSKYGIERTHLYLSCPWPLAALLGWHLASTGTLVSYEATQDRSSYVAACELV